MGKKTKFTCDPTEVIHLKAEKKRPSDYHCSCPFCKVYAGRLVRVDGTPYHRLERRAYYSDIDQKHIAKTPLHIARWAVQQYSLPGGWVIDPTMGAGTTAVEALNHGRNAFGVELEFSDVANRNATQAAFGKVPAPNFVIVKGDVRNLAAILDKLREDPGRHLPKQFDLAVNNPPYFGSGDQGQKTPIEARKKGAAIVNYTYGRDQNFAFLDEKGSYYTAIQVMYQDVFNNLKPGARLVIGIKDMMQNKQAYLLHQKIGERCLAVGFEFEKMVLLKHHPTTMFMNTYPKRFPEIRIPFYQTILVFRKPE